MATNTTHANISMKLSFTKYTASEIHECSSNQVPKRNAAPKNTIKPLSSNITLNPF